MQPNIVVWWAVWTVGLAAYLVGVMHRTSFGVAGLDAAAAVRRGARRAVRVRRAAAAGLRGAAGARSGCCSTGSGARGSSSPVR